MSEFGTVLLALDLDSDPTRDAKAKALASLGESGRPGMAWPGCTTADTSSQHRPYASAIALQLTDVDPETRSEARDEIQKLMKLGSQILSWFTRIDQHDPLIWKDFSLRAN